jgi:ankyrin repeat protein
LLLLLALCACHADEGTSDPASAAAPPPTASHVPMTPPVRIDQHFKGVDLKLAEAAARGDTVEVARLIRSEHANPNAISTEGMPLLLWPVQTRNVDGTRALLDNGANPNQTIPRFGAPIVLVAQLDDPSWLRLFLDHGGDPDLRNADDEPLTRVAMLAGHWASVQLLIERGANVDAGVHGNETRTALGFYAGGGQFDKVHWLLEHGADPTLKLAQAPVAERIGAPVILESIYWYPIDASKFPDGAQWQRKAQQWLRTHGISEVPPEPASMRKQRESMGLPKPLYQ